VVGRGLLVALEGAIDGIDRGEPLDVGHAVPAGHDQAKRRAVLGLERAAVHLVGEEDLRANPLLDREAALVVLLQVSLDPAVRTGEDQLHRRRVEAGLLEQRRQPGAGPLRGPDGLEEPGLTQRARREPGSAIAGAFERDGQRLPGTGPQVRERELERLPHEATDAKAPRRGLDRRDVEVRQQVVQPDRRDVVSERLERHSAIAGCELELLEAQRSIGRLGAHAGRMPRPEGGISGCRCRTPP
jgi:hypothetical protein